MAFIPSLSWAADSLTGTSGGSFLKIGQGSARAMGIGRAYVALAEGSDALTVNPAGLGLTQQKEIVYSYLRYVQDVDTPLYLGYAHPMGRTVIGADFSYVTVSGIDARDEIGRPLESTRAQVRDGLIGVGLARSFWYEKLFLGGSLHVVHEDIVGSVHDTVVGDIGVIVKPNNVITLGFSMQDLGAGRANISRIARAGAALRVGEFVTAATEVNKASDSDAKVGVGLEFLLPEEYLEFGSLTFRAGYYTADNLGQNFDSRTLQAFKLDRSNGFSFGFGLFTSRAFGYGVSIDYAVVPSGSLGTQDQISLKVKF